MAEAGLGAFVTDLLVPLHHSAGGELDGFTVAVVLAVIVVAGLIGLGVWSLIRQRRLQGP